MPELPTYKSFCAALCHNGRQGWPSGWL